MIRLRTLPFFLAVLLLAATGLRAQRPQGSDTAFTDIITVGSSLVALTNDGRILRSTDGGISYTQIHSVASNEFFALAANGNTVIAAGSDGILHRADFGIDPEVWTDLEKPALIGELRGIAARNTGTWIAVGDAILHSPDNGDSWSIPPTSVGDLNAVTHVGGDIWVAVGGVFSAKIYRSTTNGLTWSAVTAPAASALRAVAADGFGNVLAVGRDGTALFSEDQGATFTVVGSVNASESLNAVVSTGENTWIIGGEQRTLISLDEGTASTLLQPLEDLNTEGLALLNGAVVMAGVAVVPAPVISSPLTVSTEPIQVTLVADPAVDSTHYSVDGNDPSSASTTYAAPFWVTDDLTVKAVSVQDGVYSVIVSQAFQADLIEYDLSIALSGASLLITLSDSLDGQPYQLQYSDNLAAVPQVWTNEGDPKPGTGNALLWTLTPIPGGTRAWRAVLP